MIIKPFKLKGEITAPPSKSMAHRLLILGAFSKESTIENVAFSKDIKATLSCLENLGAKIKIDKNTVTLGGFGDAQNTTLFANESGSTLRFMLPICLLTDKEITLSGTHRLFERDMSAFEEFSKKYNFFFQKDKDFIKVKGKLTPGSYEIDASLSSQFVSGLLMALSFLEGESEVKLKNKIESKPYIDLTLKALGDFGINAFWENEDTVKIISQGIENKTLAVEGDYSNAAFLDAFNFLGNEVKINGLCQNSKQGDKIYKTLFEKLGREIIDLKDCPDLAPVLFALSSTVGECHFVGTHRLKIKESDRANAMKEELEKFGVKVKVEENAVTVFGGKITPPTCPLNSHNDHRIAMSLTVLLSLTGGELTGEDCVSKSYPDFFEVIEKLKEK